MHVGNKDSELDLMDHANSKEWYANRRGARTPAVLSSSISPDGSERALAVYCGVVPYMVNVQGCSTGTPHHARSLPLLVTSKFPGLVGENTYTSRDI